MAPSDHGNDRFQLQTPGQRPGGPESDFLSATGTRDRGATGGGPEWKKEPFDHSPPGNKHHACYEGGHHGSFSGKFASDATGRAIFEHSQRLALAFFDAYLKDDEKALALLKSNEPTRWNESRLDYFQR